MSQNRLLFAWNCQLFGFLTQYNFDLRLRDRLNTEHTVSGDRLAVVSSNLICFQHQQSESAIARPAKTRISSSL